MKAHRFAGIINDPTVKDGTTKIFDRSVGNKDFQLYLYNMPESLGWLSGFKFRWAAGY